MGHFNRQAGGRESYGSYPIDDHGKRHHHEEGCDSDHVEQPVPTIPKRMRATVNGAMGAIWGVPMSRPEGFEYKARKNGEVVISHNGHKAALLRGDRAKKFLNRIKTRDPQEVMARMTGNYKK
jgi:hypothetical protein